MIASMKKLSAPIVAVLCAIALACSSITITGCSNGSAEKEASEGGTHIFVDSLGREVEVPDNIERVCPSGHTAQQVLLTIAPDKMVGLSQALTDDQLMIFGDQFKNYPIFGAVLGAKDDFNREAVANANPQIIIDTGEAKKDTAESLDALQEQLGIPCVFIESKLDDYGSTYETLGELLGMEDRGKELADYCTNVYNETKGAMETIPENERVTVAYLLGNNGLNAIAKTSFQAQVIDMVANNVVVVDDASGKGTGNEISLEQIALWDPEVIIFQAGSIYDTVGSDPAWQGLQAIQNGKYYQVPDNPWCWMNNPPTVNMLMGMQWLPRLLYPGKFNDTIPEVTRAYYKTMYQKDLSDEELDSILQGATLD